MIRNSSKLLIRFGARVRELRQLAGLSQEAFAWRCGLDRTYISGIERGKRNVSLQNLKVLAKTLNVSLSGLLDEL
jgi:transcriptional regulator with XRE-family HTH domain